jgi:hypothetical protein
MTDIAPEALTPAATPTPTDALTPAATPTAAEALTRIVTILELLKPEDRRRTLHSVMRFFDEPADPISVRGALAERKVAKPSAHLDNGSYSPAVSKWMEQNDISPEELEEVFNIRGDGDFEIHDVPGKAMKERTINTYVLTGLGKLLASDERTFDDDTARGFCQRLGCLDKGNHSTILKERRGGEFTGDKSKGYSLTPAGLRRAATLVKELAGTAK